MKDELITIRKSELDSVISETVITVMEIYTGKTTIRQRVEIRSRINGIANDMIKSGDLQTINPN